MVTAMCRAHGALPDFLPGYQRVEDEAVRAKFESAWGCSLNSSPGLSLAEMFEAAHQGQIKAVYLIGENPVLSEPDIQHKVCCIHAMHEVGCH